MYIVIVGAGDIGAPLIDVATKSGNEVVVVEKDVDKANEVANSQDCLVLNADATTKETLREAGAERADAVISTTDQDATNIMVCLLAKEFQIPGILSVVHEPQHMSVFREIGVNTMQNPQELIAEYLYRAVSRPAIVDYMRIGEDAEVFEIEVTEGAPVAGRRIHELAQEGLLGEEMLIVAIERDDSGHPITPKGNTRIEAHDLLTVYSGVGAEPEIMDIFGHGEDHAV
jgi:trk system potassium uptake protein TrkA